MISNENSVLIFAQNSILENCINRPQSYLLFPCVHCVPLFPLCPVSPVRLLSLVSPVRPVSLVSFESLVSPVSSVSPVFPVSPVSLVSPESLVVPCVPLCSLCPWCPLCLLSPLCRLCLLCPLYPLCPLCPVSLVHGWKSRTSNFVRFTFSLSRNRQLRWIFAGFRAYRCRTYSDLFVVQLKPLTDCIVQKTGGNKLSVKQAFQRVVLGEMAQRRSWGLAENGLVYFGLF